MVRVSLSLCFVALVAIGFIVNDSVAAEDKKNEGDNNNSEEIKFYELKKGDFSVKFTNWGATIVSVFLPDKDGMILFHCLVCGLFIF